MSSRGVLVSMVNMCKLLLVFYAYAFTDPVFCVRQIIVLFTRAQPRSILFNFIMQEIELQLKVDRICQNCMQKSRLICRIQKH